MKRDNMHDMTVNHHRKLWIMALLSFVSMYILMYSMVNGLGILLTNVNQVYMAGLMTAPMIPHHAGAILMCEQASIQDAEIQQFCQTIITSQQQEINQMKARLEELDQE